MLWNSCSVLNSSTLFLFVISNWRMSAQKSNFSCNDREYKFDLIIWKVCLLNYLGSILVCILMQITNLTNLFLICAMFSEIQYVLLEICTSNWIWHLNNINNPWSIIFCCYNAVKSLTSTAESKIEWILCSLAGLSWQYMNPFKSNKCFKSSFVSKFTVFLPSDE